MKKALYPGSFDPPTLGHEWVLSEALKLFDEVVIGIATNPDKKYTFTADARRDMLCNVIRRLSCKWQVTLVDMPNYYTARYAKEIDANCIIRGVRNTIDFEVESAFRQINEDIAPEISTVFLIPPAHLRPVSSSMVKGLVGFEGWKEVARSYVSPYVLHHIIENSTK